MERVFPLVCLCSCQGSRDTGPCSSPRRGGMLLVEPGRLKAINKSARLEARFNAPTREREDHLLLYSLSLSLSLSPFLSAFNGNELRKEPSIALTSLSSNFERNTLHCQSLCNRFVHFATRYEEHEARCSRLQISKIDFTFGLI